MSQYQSRQPELEGRYSNGCRGKVPYTSRRRAQGALRVKLAHGVTPEAARALNTYRCRVCKHWHVGKRSRRS